MNNPVEELQPCPFCGSLLVALVGMTVRCGKCCAAGPFSMTREEAVRVWNTRPMLEPGLSEAGSHTLEPEHVGPLAVPKN